MAQLRQDFDEYTNRDTLVLVIGPEDAPSFADYFAKNDLPFYGLPDPKHRVLKLYGQEVNLFKLGRMPAQVVIDRSGVVRFVHYGSGMWDIPSTEEMITLLDRLQAESQATESGAAE